MQIPDTVRTLMNTLERAGFETWAVGGCIRDSLLGLVPHDWDLCTAAAPQDMLQVFSGRQLITAGIRHGTVGVITDGGTVEITAFRTERGYADHRHPDSVQFVRRIEDDLCRRDFTVNAMAYAPARGLLDLFGGRDDLRRGMIRCVGCAPVRFQEDALRILRGLRFAARYGFRVDADTAAAMHACAGSLSAVSVQRLFTELCGIVTAPSAGRTLAGYCDVLSVILPQLDTGNWHSKCAALDTAVQELPVRLALLFPDADSARAGLRLLGAPGSILKTVPDALQAASTQKPADKPGARRLISRLGRETAHICAELLRLRSDGGHAAALIDTVLESEQCFTVTDLAISGSDLLTLGFSGPAVGQALHALLALVMDEKTPNTRDALLRAAAGLSSDSGRTV